MMSRTVKRLLSNDFVYTPGMVENYVYARKVGDKDYQLMFEKLYPTLTYRELNRLANKAYSVDGDAVLVGADE